MRIPFSTPTPTERSIRHGRHGELLMVIRQTSKVSVQNQLRHANCPLHARKTNSDNHPATNILETTSSPPPSLAITALLLSKTCYSYCHYNYHYDKSSRPTKWYHATGYNFPRHQTCGQNRTEATSTLACPSLSGIPLVDVNDPKEPHRKWMARRFVNGHHRDLQTIFKNNKSCHEMSTS